jgi:HD superfamily phosphohydrolase YqeK
MSAMKNEQFENLVQWFGDYVQRFYSQAGDEYLNNNLRLKETHTHRVCGETRLLADALKLNDNDARIAETIALLHDIGRFEQFKKYRTYKDATSEDHSTIGLRVMKEERVLEDYDPQERIRIERAVEYHNKKVLPEGLDEQTELFSKIIRDADKLDIYYLIIENLKRYYANPCTFKLEMEFPDNPRCSPDMLAAVEQGRLIDYTMLRTLSDAILLQIGWVYDIYFDATLRRIVEKRFLEQYISWLPDTDEVKRATDAVMRYVEKRLGN